MLSASQQGLRSMEEYMKRLLRPHQHPLASATDRVTFPVWGIKQMESYIPGGTITHNKMHFQPQRQESRDMWPTGQIGEDYHQISLK
jgi:hypothetical protein